MYKQQLCQMVFMPWLVSLSLEASGRSESCNITCSSHACLEGRHQYVQKDRGRYSPFLTAPLSSGLKLLPHQSSGRDSCKTLGRIKILIEVRFNDGVSRLSKYNALLVLGLSHALE